ncbi:MAG TPA: hypothetical protein VGB37_05340 [Candidatus Lokiarchaeia archaeon]
MKKFTIFWLTGKTEIIEGNTPVEAFNNAGIGSGALRAIDFYREGEKVDDYKWDKENHTWIKIREELKK